RSGDARGDYIIIGLIALEHQPHRLNIIGCPTPVSLDVDVAEMKGLAAPGRDAPRGGDDLPRDVALGTQWGLVVEENPGAGLEAVGFAVIGDLPVRRRFRHRVRTPR